MPLLHWLTREDDIYAAGRTPYRLLEEMARHSQGDRDAGNLLIHGDNLDALKALLPYYAGRVKCIYIDPPYNTGAAFEHYDDNLEHDEMAGDAVSQARTIARGLVRGRFDLDFHRQPSGALPQSVDGRGGRTPLGYLTPASGNRERHARIGKSSLRMLNTSTSTRLTLPSSSRQEQANPDAGCKGALQEPRQWPAWSLAICIGQCAGWPRDGRSVLDEYRAPNGK